MLCFAPVDRDGAQLLRLDPRENTAAPIEIPAERKPVDRGEAAVARDFQRQMDDEFHSNGARSQGGMTWNRGFNMRC